MLQHMPLLGIYLKVYFCDDKGGRRHLQSRTSLSEQGKHSTQGKLKMLGYLSSQPHTPGQVQTLLL